MSWVILTILLLIEWAAWRSIRRTISSWKRFRLARAVWAGLAAAFFIFFFIVIVKPSSWLSDCQPCFIAFVATFVTLFSPKFILAVFELFESVFLAIRRALAPKSSRAGISRRSFLTAVGQGSAGLFFGGLLYGMLHGRFNYSVRRVEVAIAGLPRAFDGFRIVQISDLHLGSFLGHNDRVEAGFQKVRDLDPDLLCFTGDLVNIQAEEATPWLDSLQSLQGRYGKYAVLGNHDYGDYGQFPEGEKEQVAADVLDSYRAMGFGVLLNENVEIVKNGAAFTLAGVENWGAHFKRAGDLNLALQGAPEQNHVVLMSHDPTHFEMEVMGKAPRVALTLSGHTHGLQMGIEIPALGIKASPAGAMYRFWGGLYQIGTQYLYVNRGFGYLGMPGRIGMPPEITELTLRSV
ncbi:MAG: metallophosphoesterase [Flavobacteriales bacterium]|nr:metallophosphoesterase [Flavobacteriales bacterium]